MKRMITSRWIPSGYTLFTENKELGIEVYSFQNEKGIYAIGYRGKSLKSSFHYRYVSIERMTEAVKDWMASIEKREQDKIDAKAKDKADADTFFNAIKVGDIFVCSWGYDQTNVDFYQVIEKKEKSLVFQKIGYASHKDTGFMQGEVTAEKDKFIGKPFIKMKSAIHYNYISMTSYSSMSKWDGSPEYRSTYA